MINEDETSEEARNFIAAHGLDLYRGLVESQRAMRKNEELRLRALRAQQEAKRKEEEEKAIEESEEDEDEKSPEQRAQEQVEFEEWELRDLRKKVLTKIENKLDEPERIDFSKLKFDQLPLDSQNEVKAKMQSMVNEAQRQIDERRKVFNDMLLKKAKTFNEFVEWADSPMIAHHFKAFIEILKEMSRDPENNAEWRIILTNEKTAPNEISIGMLIGNYTKPKDPKPEKKEGS
jgi:hypothetical protein